MYWRPQINNWVFETLAGHGGHISFLLKTGNKVEMQILSLLKIPVEKRAVLVIIFIARIGAIALLFLINPALAILVNILLDYADGPLYKYYLKIPPLQAQYLDKSLDYLYYIALLTLIFIERLTVWPLLLLLFLLRTAGEIFFFVTGEKQIFIYFPNFFEYFTLVFFLIKAIDPALLSASLNWVALLLLTATWFRVWNEYFLHKEGRTFFQVIWLPIFRSLGLKFTEEITE